MPELKDVNREGWQDADVDVSVLCCTALFLLTGKPKWDTYAYTDPAKEASRLAELEKTKRVDKIAEAEKRRKEAAEKKKANAAWSNKVAKKEEKEKRKLKKENKRKWLKEQQKSAEATNNDKKRSRGAGEDEDDDGDDWEELAREERMAKKLKRGEISQKEFDNAFADL